MRKLVLAITVQNTMFRTVIGNSCKRIARQPQVLARSSRIVLPAFCVTNKVQFPSAIRWYSHAPELTEKIITERVVEILESFDKISDPSKISGSASFSKDLGLDSLDVVEVIMAIEEEFSVEIPDHQADEIKTVQQAIEFIAAQPDAA